LGSHPEEAGDGFPRGAILDSAGAALLVAQYDPVLAREFLAPAEDWLRSLVARGKSLSQVGPPSGVDLVVAAAAVLDVDSATKLIEAFPPPKDLWTYQPKTGVKLAAARALMSDWNQRVNTVLERHWFQWVIDKEDL
jgi:hypothetical protein